MPTSTNNEKFELAITRLNTHFGEFEFRCYSWGSHEEDNILALCKAYEGDWPIVRVQSAYYTAEIFRSLDCDCHEQLEASLTRVQEEGGVILYMLCDGRGAGLLQKIRGLELSRTERIDTADAYVRLGLSLDSRKYPRVSQVLRDLQIGQVRLLTNNPRKVIGLMDHGIEVRREPLEIIATHNSRPYLLAKRKKLGHLLVQFDEKRHRPQDHLPIN